MQEGDGDLGAPKQIVCSDVHPEVTKPAINTWHLWGSEVACLDECGQMCMGDMACDVIGILLYNL